MNDNDLNETELTRVSNALDALEKHNNQPTTNAWEAIMEESNNRSRRMSRRTQLISAAAAAVVVIAITGAAIVVTSNGNNKTVKTVDKKKHENVSTSTTAPLTPEQKLLQDTVVMKSVAEGPGGSAYGTEVFDTLTGKKLSDVALPGYPAYSAAQFSHGQVNFRTSNEYCEGEPGAITSASLDLATLKMTSRKIALRAYSPSGNKYLEIAQDCAVGAQSLTITDTQSKETLVFNPVKVMSPDDGGINDNNPYVVKTTASNAFWVDENHLIIQRNEGIEKESGEPITDNESGWYTLDLTAAKSLTDAKVLDILCCGSAGYGEVHDVIVENGKTLVLVSGLTRTDDGSDTNLLRVINAANGSTLWSTTISDQGVSSATFGHDSSEVYGSYLRFVSARDFSLQAFGYDHDTNTKVLPDGGILIPLFR